MCKGGSADRRWGIVTLPENRPAPRNITIPPSRLRRATSLYTREALRVVRRGRRCGVAQRSMPQWGIEPHERASSAGWRRSLCAAKRRRPGQSHAAAKPRGRTLFAPTLPYPLTPPRNRTIITTSPIAPTYLNAIRPTPPPYPAAKTKDKICLKINK